ncbi:hypothetical protein DSC45_13600 [Streptomyces sp. YIM 130001]|nr:hypothetical protein DSC45_13600 [Streptomyces sp. YIM 130001]
MCTLPDPFRACRLYDDLAARRIPARPRQAYGSTPRPRPRRGVRRYNQSLSDSLGVPGSRDRSNPAERATTPCPSLGSPARGRPIGTSQSAATLRLPNGRGGPLFGRSVSHASRPRCQRSRRSAMDCSHHGVPRSPRATFALCTRLRARSSAAVSPSFTAAPTARRAAMRPERRRAAVFAGISGSVARQRRPPTKMYRPSGVRSGLAEALIHFMLAHLLGPRCPVRRGRSAIACAAWSAGGHVPWGLLAGSRCRVRSARVPASWRLRNACREEDPARSRVSVLRFLGPGPADTEVVSGVYGHS